MVKNVEVFNTVLTTVDGKTIIIPNSTAIGWSIVNFSIEKNKRLDITVWVGYDTDLKKAKEVLG